MKKFSTFIAPVGLAFGSLAIATTAMSASATVRPAVVAHTTNAPTYSGTVSSLPHSGHFLLKIGTKNYTIKLESKTTLTIAGTTAAFSALKKGESVTITGTLKKRTIDASTIVALH